MIFALAFLNIFFFLIISSLYFTLSKTETKIDILSTDLLMIEEMLKNKNNKPISQNEFQTWTQAFTSKVSNLEDNQEDQKRKYNGIKSKIDSLFTSEQAIDLFDKAIGGLRQRFEGLESSVVTKDIFPKLLEDHSEHLLEKVKKTKEERWESLEKAFAVRK